MELKHVPDGAIAQSGQLAPGQHQQVTPVEQDPPAVGTIEHTEQVQQRALADPRFPHYRHAVGGFDHQIHSPQYFDDPATVVERSPQIPHFEYRRPPLIHSAALRPERPVPPSMTGTDRRPVR